MEQSESSIHQSAKSKTLTPRASDNNMDLYYKRKPCATKMKSYGHRKVIDPPKPLPVLSSYDVHFVISVIFLLSATALSAQQQQSNYCPRTCNCDDRKLEVLCKGPLDTGLSGIPLTFNPNLERLTINNAQTSQLTGVDSVNKLTRLDLTNNRLTQIDFSDLTRNPALLSFNSGHNSIIELKDSMITNLLLELDMLMHNFDKFDERIETELHKKLPMISLEELDLSYNSLTILRNLTFARLPNLKYLDISSNQLSILENHSLFGLGSLEKINLRANRLVQLPTIALQGTTRFIFNKAKPSRPDQSQLKHLDLSGNPLKFIGGGAFSMVGHVQEIYLESCSIQSISDRAFEGLRSLQTLSLEKNFIQKIPSQSFAHLSALKLLILNENNISSIEVNSFSDLVSLQELQISHGSFKELKIGAFSGLNNLQRLKVSHNPSLTTIRPGVFENLDSLSFLDLQSNSLPHIPADANHESLISIDLRNNPLECGCDLRWLTSWLRKSNETLQAKAKIFPPNNANEHHGNSYEPFSMAQTLNLTCSRPAALAGQPVIDLPIFKLECLEPTSELNVFIGYVALFAISTILVLVCMINFIQNKKHLLTLLKENLVQNHMPVVVSPYTLNLHKNVDNLKKETQLYSSDYENIDYGPQAQIYSVQGDQIMYYSPPQQLQHSQQI